MNNYEFLSKVFSSRKRPKNFIDNIYFEELEEHEAVLQARNNDTISFRDVGNIAYSPISFINLEGFLYYLPGLARLAKGVGDEYFLDTFLIFFENKRRRNSLNLDERKALLYYLLDLKTSNSSSIEKNGDCEDLNELIGWLSQRGKKG
ncbi:MAG: hypothetical protein DWP95_06025 [Proteobacteria bacterium]|nr:MAG: hypothetical protein DWP95_06025 [Pseudomonadota bacterium]